MYAYTCARNVCVRWQFLFLPAMSSMVYAHKRYLTAKSAADAATRTLISAKEELAQAAVKRGIDPDAESPELKRRIVDALAAEATTTLVSLVTTHPSQAWDCSSIRNPTAGDARICARRASDVCRETTDSTCYYVCRWDRSLVICQSCFYDRAYRDAAATAVRPVDTADTVLAREHSALPYRDESTDAAVARACNHGGASNEQWRCLFPNALDGVRVCTACDGAIDERGCQYVLVGHPSVRICGGCSSKISDGRFYARDKIAAALDARRVAERTVVAPVAAKKKLRRKIPDEDDVAPAAVEMKRKTHVVKKK